jgi:hypothetical protein
MTVMGGDASRNINDKNVEPDWQNCSAKRELGFQDLMDTG